MSATEYRACRSHPSVVTCLPFTGPGIVAQIVYFEKIRVFKAGVAALNTLAWNNRIGLGFYFVGF